MKSEFENFVIVFNNSLTVFSIKSLKIEFVLKMSFYLNK